MRRERFKVLLVWFLFYFVERYKLESERDKAVRTWSNDLGFCTGVKSVAEMALSCVVSISRTKLLALLVRRS